MAERASRRWFVIRVSVLLAVLAGVLVYAADDVLRRRARTEWERTLDVALVVVRDGRVDDGAVNELRSRTRELESVLARQFARFRSKPARPFSFVGYGPATLTEPIPAPPGEGLVEAAKHAWALRRFTSSIDAQAGVPTRGFDARLYLVVQPPSERGLVEGMSEHGGRVGIAQAELDASTVGLALFVATHELLHTLGATDRYGPDGTTLIPEGLAEPDREPRFPQRYAEIMARNRPLDETREVPPLSLDELWVGEKTAAEIGWRRER